MKKRLLAAALLILLLWWYYVSMNVDRAQDWLNSSKNALQAGKSQQTPIKLLSLPELQTTANKLVKDVATKFKFQTVKLVWQKCDEDNAYYDPETQSITMCLEMVDSISAYAVKQDNDPNVQKQIATNSLMFFLLHELGHAYIDLQELPVTGKEEDVADQIATYFILELKKDDGFDWIADGAFTFYQYSEENPDIDDDALADVHSLDKQRFYNVACWLYGATADESIVDDWWLPEDRAEWCEDEYNLMSSSLDALLK